jgi:predicted metal-binding membrane protein
MTAGPAMQTSAEAPPASAALAAGMARRWRLLTLVAVAALAALGWIWLAAAISLGGSAPDMGPGMAALAPLFDRMAALVPGAAALGGGHGPLMPAMTAWGWADAGLVFLMWAAMVFAMMVPTAAPTFRAYAAAGGRRALPVMAGYTAVWLAIAVVATAGQAGLTAVGALAPHMAPAGVALSASVLIAAGIYQFTPLKMACLVRCRNPRAAFAAGRGAGTAFRIGVEEGLACLGCCWALMAVMFAAGLMNVVAMAFLGVLMGIEKLVSGVFLSYVMGVILLLLGLALASGSYIG